jgi:hypothetical protein
MAENDEQKQMDEGTDTGATAGDAAPEMNNDAGAAAEPMPRQEDANPI